MSLILLDRDGVINEDTPAGVTSPQQLKLIKGSAQAIADLNAAGLKVAIITNQSVVGRGLIRSEQLQEIHAHMCDMLAQNGARIDAIYACTDAPDAPTHRRKPAAGMLEEALADFAASPAQTPMVGDALRDMQAALAAGCQRHLVQTGKGADTAKSLQLEPLSPVKTHTDLAAFVSYWLRSSSKLA